MWIEAVSRTLWSVSTFTFCTDEQVAEFDFTAQWEDPMADPEQRKFAADYIRLDVPIPYRNQRMCLMEGEQI